MNDTSEAGAGEGKARLSPRTSPVDIPDAERMREELHSVIQSPEFARAPIMKRLLTFLVNETAAGRGDQLKAYSVAVDGLGRAPDYDARADSYPRVQVGRLRRMLDGYYGSTRPAGGVRLAIPSGRYRVTLRSEEPEAETADLSAADILPAKPLAFWGKIAALLLLIGFVTAVLLTLLPMRADLGQGREKPILELGGSQMARRSELGNLVRITLIDGLGRSGMYDLRPLRRSGTRDPQAAPPRYRLGIDLIPGDHPRLFLRLSAADPERLIWSGDVSLANMSDLDGDTLNRRLAPVMTTIGRVNGLIATHELQGKKDRDAAGYSCMLLYHRYRKERTAGELDHVHACLERSLERDPNDAELQAAAAQLAIEKMVSSDTAARDRSAFLLTAQRHAQISASADPFDPWGNAARARVALARNACPQAINFAIRASDLQPYDPTLLADAGMYLLDCGDPRAERLIRRAILLDDDPDGRSYAPLLLLAIARDDHGMAREALSQMTPPLIGRHARFYLVSAASYAMVGDLPRARGAWAQLEAGSPSVARDPRGFFERLGYAASLRDKAMGHLRTARLVAPEKR